MESHKHEKCMTIDDFKDKGKKIRQQAIKDEFDKRFPDPDNNGEEYYYTKGLPHNSNQTDPKYGEVDQNAYKKLLKAICTGKPSFSTYVLERRGEDRKS